MPSNVAQKALIGWAVHVPKIIRAFLHTKERISMNVIQCYAPTNDSEEEFKDQFYNRLQSVIHTFPERDVIIWMGDFNAKIGGDNIGYEEVMEQHVLGIMKDNRERLADLSSLNKLVLDGSMSPHRRLHRTTWLSPDQSTENQIDHFSIGERFRRSLKYVRMKRSADVASDHHLVVANLKLILEKN